MTDQHRPFEQPDLSDRKLEELIREAGPREPAPQEDLAAIRAATHAAWHQATGTRETNGSPPSKTNVSRFPVPRALSRLPSLALAASLLVALGIAGWWAMTATPEHSPVAVARIDVVVGTVETSASEASGSTVAEAGLDLLAGSTVVTRADSRVALILHSGPQVRLDGSSRIRLLGDGLVQLERGAVYVDTDGSGGIEIHAGHVIARDIGTQFEVRRIEADGVRISVREGTVLVDVTGVGETVEAGQQLTIHQDGSTVTGSLQPSDPFWSWTLSTARFALEGRTMAEFLHWVERENAWTIEYETPDLERRAQEAILSRTFADAEVIPDLAHTLDLLPSAGMRGELEDDRLLVSERTP